MLQSGSRTVRRRRIGRCGIVLSALLVLMACAQDTPDERLARATGQFEQGEFRVAYVELRNVLQAEPENAAARLLLGRTLTELADFESAVIELRRAAELGAPAGGYAVALATGLTRLGRGAEALEVLGRVGDGSRGAAWLSAEGDALAASGEFIPARASYQRALELGEGGAAYDPLVGLARIDGARRSLADSLEFANRAIELRPERPEAYLARGRIRMAGQDLAAAASDFDRAARLMTGGTLTQLELSNLLALADLQFTLRRAEPLDATAALAGERAPDSDVAYFIQGLAHHLNGRYAEAELSLQNAVTRSPENPRARLILGVNSLAMENLGQAEQHLREALQLQPENLAATRLLAETMRLQGRPAAALDRLAELPEADTDPALLALRGMLHYELDEPARGVVLLERALQASPGDIGIQLQLARGYIADSRPEDASALFAESLGPFAGRAVTVAVELLEILPAAEAARARADELLAADGAGIDARIGVALFLSTIGDREAARAELEEAVERDPAAVTPRMMLASFAMAENEPAVARRLFESIVDDAPDEYRAWLGLARLAAADQVPAEALRLTQRAADAAPDAWLPRLLLGRQLLASGDRVAAAAAAEGALALAPDNSDTLTLAGEMALRDGRAEAAVGYLREAAERDPARAARRFVLAQAELAAGNLAVARELARELQAELPGVAQPYVLESAILARSDGAGDPGEPLERWLQATPADSGAWLRLAEIRQSQGRMDDALAGYERAIELGPDRVVALNNAAWLLNEAGNARALSYARRAYELAPEAAPVLDTYGWVLLRQSSAAEALPVLEEAAAGAPDAADIQYHYAYALAETGDAAAARGILERVLDAGTSFSSREQAAALLARL